MNITVINSHQDYYKVKNQLKNDISSLKQKPEKLHALATRLKSNEPGASNEISPLLSDIKIQLERVGQLLKLFTSNTSDKFASNREQKRTEARQYQNDLKQAVDNIKAAENHLVASEKMAIAEYNNNRQLVNFDDDDSNSNGRQQTMASADQERMMQKRQEAMQKIERDIVNVNLIYKELNTLVYQQGEQIDNIEDHIDQADMEVDEGLNQLEQAATHAVSARKKKICLTLFCIAAGLTVLLILLISAKVRPGG